MTTATHFSAQLAADERGETPPGQPRQCSWCQRFYNSKGDYVEAPFFVMNLSHGICKRCFETQKERLKELKSA